MREARTIESNQMLENVRRGMAITADLSRSDLMLVFPRNPEQVVVVAQALPHSIASIYDESMVNRTLTREDAPVILEAWHRRRHIRVQRDLIPSGAPIQQDVYPIAGEDGTPVALLSFETSLIQLERHRQRHKSFRRAVDWLKSMCLRGELAPAADLSPFTEWDGVLLVDPQRRITYLSGIANNLYRRLGYLEDMRGRRLSMLSTSDDEMVLSAMNQRRPIEREVQENSLIWIRKVLPVWSPPTVSGWMQSVASLRHRPGEISGVIIMVHDATDERRKRQELQVKTTMIQEVHHRVKNNLQTIAAMLRMQARRAEDPATLQALNEAVARILSVAVIHEFLSLKETQSINMRDVGQRIISQNRQVMIPGRQVSFSLEGPVIYLPTQQATSCALVINELMQNALEHGFEVRKDGQIFLRMFDEGESVRIEITDDGDPLPSDFSLDRPTSLGLQIVRTLVVEDLHGELSMQSGESGVLATVRFPKVSTSLADSGPNGGQ